MYLVSGKYVWHAVVSFEKYEEVDTGLCCFVPGLLVHQCVLLFEKYPHNNNIIRSNSRLNAITIFLDYSTHSELLTHIHLTSPKHPSTTAYKMHCNSFIFLVSGLVGIAVAPPPPHRPEITTMGPHKTAATLSISKVIAHKTASSSIPKATAHKTASSSISKVTALTHSTDNGITTVGDVVTATIIEIGMYPPEEVWTTIHRGSSSSTAKAQETSQVIKAVEKSNSSMKVKVQQTEKPANKEKATKTAKVKVAPTHVAPSTCTTYYPSIMRQISETFPDILQEDTANTTKAFHVGRHAQHRAKTP